MKRFTEIREARRSAQDRLSARAAKHGLGSKKRLDKIKKSSDFFSKPPPSYSKDDLKKMGYAVESTEVHVRMDHLGKKADDVNKVLDAYIKKGVIKHAFTTDKGEGFNLLKKAMLPALNRDLKKFYIQAEVDEAKNPAQQAAIAIAKKANQVMSLESVDEAYYRGQRRATPKKQEPPKMGSKSGSGYDLYHKSYSGALQHAYAWAKKKGYTVDPDDIDSKVASGPKKPSEGRTNSFTLKLKDNPKKMLAVQVYGMGGGKYELNTYIT